MTGPLPLDGTLHGSIVQLVIDGADTDVFIPTYLENTGYAADRMVIFTCTARCREAAQAQFDEALRQDRGNDTVH